MDHHHELHNLRDQQIDLIRRIANDPNVSTRTRLEAWDHIMQLMNEQLRHLDETRPTQP